MRVHDRVVVYGLWLDFARFLAPGPSSFSGVPGPTCVFVTEGRGSCGAFCRYAGSGVHHQYANSLLACLQLPMISDTNRKALEGFLQNLPKIIVGSLDVNNIERTSSRCCDRECVLQDRGFSCCI